MKSMTAYGRASTSFEGLNFIVELRSLNHRFLEIILKLPQKFQIFEQDIKKIISSYILRGRVDCTLKVNGELDGLPQLVINWEVAKSYYNLLRELKQGLNLEGEIGISDLMGVKDIFIPKEEDKDLQKFWPPIKEVLRKALEGLDQMRKKEGSTIKEDFFKRLESISNFLKEIEERSPLVVEEYRERLRQRINSIVEREIDESRLLQEVVFFAERSDITEEIVRLYSHLTQFREIMEASGATGRKLDFLIQEMNREINTIGVKASDAFISQRVVNIKAELEKIREQVQNIE